MYDSNSVSTNRATPTAQFANLARSKACRATRLTRCSTTPKTMSWPATLCPTRSSRPKRTRSSSARTLAQASSSSGT